MYYNMCIEIRILWFLTSNNSTTQQEFKKKMKYFYRFLPQNVNRSFFCC